MRHRVPNYTINGQYIILDTDVTIEDVRLIINETQKTVICSSMNKGNITIDGNVIEVDADVCTLAEGDYLTIEIDKGDSGEELAKQGDNPEATNSKILEEVQKIPNITRLYTAYAVKNDDGENTYSIVLPVSADAIDNGDETVTLKLQ